MIELNERVKLSVKRRDALKTIPLQELGFISKSCMPFDAIEQIKSMYYHMYIEKLYFENIWTDISISILSLF